MIFTGIAIFVSIVILIYFPQIPREQWPLRLALSLQLGGALGNLIDRLVYGTVTDFVMVGSFPVFNVADASISTGVGVLLVAMLFEGRETQEDATETDEDTIAEGAAGEGSETQMG